MASGDDPGGLPGPLRGLFGSFVSSAEQGADTATVWSNLKDAATSWASGTLQAIYGSQVTDEQIAERAQSLLSGITVQQVNQARSLAGQYVTAKQNAANRAPGEQFLGTDIFTAPWSQFSQTSGAVTQYRASVTFSSTYHGINTVALSETRSFLIGPTLTNTEDLIAAAKAWYGKLPYNKQLSDIEVTDFALEVV